MAHDRHKYLEAIPYHASNEKATEGNNMAKVTYKITISNDDCAEDPRENMPTGYEPTVRYA